MLYSKKVIKFLFFVLFLSCATKISAMKVEYQGELFFDLEKSAACHISRSLASGHEVTELRKKLLCFKQSIGSEKFSECFNAIPKNIRKVIRKNNEWFLLRIFDLERRACALDVMKRNMSKKNTEESKVLMRDCEKKHKSVIERSRKLACSCKDEEKNVRISNSLIEAADVLLKCLDSTQEEVNDFDFGFKEKKYCDICKKNGKQNLFLWHSCVAHETCIKGMELYIAGILKEIKNQKDRDEMYKRVMDVIELSCGMSIEKYLEEKGKVALNFIFNTVGIQAADFLVKDYMGN